MDSAAVGSESAELLAWGTASVEVGAPYLIAQVLFSQEPGPRRFHLRVDHRQFNNLSLRAKVRVRRWLRSATDVVHREMGLPVLDTSKKRG